MRADEFPALDMRRDVQNFQRKDLRGDGNGLNTGFLVRLAQGNRKEI